MVEQRVIIKLINKKNDKILGKLILSAENSTKKIFDNFSTPKMQFENVPKVKEPNNTTPIQYNSKSQLDQGARIMLLEETPYQLRFESSINRDEKPFFPTLIKEQDNKSIIFEEWRIGKNKNKLEGTLNFHSYVGKSFFDVKIGDIISYSHPFEV